MPGIFYFKISLDISTFITSRTRAQKTVRGPLVVMLTKTMKLRIKTYIFLLVSSWSFIQGQTLTTIQIKESDLPKDIKLSGQLKSAITFSDASGEHLLILTESGEFVSKNADSDDYRNSELHAFHYLKTNQSFVQTWKVYDFIKECPVDIETEFLPSSPTITDLDNDGIAEIWVIYKTVCHGDVSPSDMKVIMYEDKQKHAMRGRNKVEYAPGQFEGGEYNFDQAFNSAPSSFRQFATDLWTKNVNQIWK